MDPAQRGPITSGSAVKTKVSSADLMMTLKGTPMSGTGGEKGPWGEEGRSCHGPQELSCSGQDLGVQTPAPQTWGWTGQPCPAGTRRLTTAWPWGGVAHLLPGCPGVPAGCSHLVGPTEPTEETVPVTPQNQAPRGPVAGLSPQSSKLKATSHVRPQRTPSSRAWAAPPVLRTHLSLSR